MPAPEQPISHDATASIDRLRAHWERAFGWRVPEAEARAQIIFDTNGRAVRSTNSPEIAANILKGVEHPAYASIRSPALAIYAMNDVPSMYPNFSVFDAENRQRAERQVATLRAWQEGSIAQFRQEVAKGRVVTLEHANHYLFLTNQSDVIRLTRGFLEEVARP